MLQDAYEAQAVRLAALESVVGTEESPVVNAGDTAWILTSSCLVLMMTIPGLALFYGENRGSVLLPTPKALETSRPFLC